jgi:ABC-type branched-subunit amino acid transport system substrate-binding protein
MNTPIRDEQFYGPDDQASEHSKYAPKRPRGQSQSPRGDRPYVNSGPMAPSEYQDRRMAAEFASRPESVPEPPPLPMEDSALGLIGRITMVVSVAAVVALLAIFAKPITQGLRALISDTPTSEASKPSDKLAVNSEGARPSERSVATAAQAKPLASGAVVANASTELPPAGAQAQQVPQVQQVQTPQQQAALAPTSQEPKSPPFRGVTDTEIRFGIVAPFTGPAKELGQNIRLGIETAFRAANASGGVFGRQLRLIAADDGYDPTRTGPAMRQLFEKDQVFGIVGNVGTPTAVVALPYALDRKMLFFGAFTGAGLLRSDPPDRYVFNYRASYAEETESIVQYLVKVRKIRPRQIAVFAQQDAYGDAGFAGVAKAMRSLPGGDENAILRLNYQRNTVDVDEAVAQLKASKIPIKAVIMVPTYRAAAKFIEKTRDAYPDMIYSSVSFVGSTALANELMLLGKKYAAGVIVTQVVPVVDGHSSLVLDYKSALAKYFPGEAPDYVSLEGYVAANILISALKRNGPQLDTERLVETFENLRGLDLGLGTPVSFGRSEHQAVHKVWGSQLDENGHYQPIDLQ